MATQPKKMNIIKQVLTGHKNGLSVRRMEIGRAHV